MAYFDSVTHLPCVLAFPFFSAQHHTITTPWWLSTARTPTIRQEHPPRHLGSTSGSLPIVRLLSLSLSRPTTCIRLCCSDRFHLLCSSTPQCVRPIRHHRYAVDPPLVVTTSTSTRAFNRCLAASASDHSLSSVVFSIASAAIEWQTASDHALHVLISHKSGPTTQT